MFSFFENLVDVFPKLEPTMPPKGLMAFCLHFARPFWVPLCIAVVTAAAIAIFEVFLFTFIGSIVDWLTTAQPETFWQTHGQILLTYGLLAAFVLPLMGLFFELLTHQALLGPFAMRTRWQGHRYLLKQSTEFYQNDFAGRIATKLMQSSLAVRDTIMKLADILVYVTTFSVSVIFVLATFDLVLALPVVVWLMAYVGFLCIIMPRIKEASKAQSDSRSILTGRVVDSYTNISTVKLFSHTDREERYAREAMDDMLVTVHRQMRLVTILSSTVSLFNALLLTSTIGTAVWLWSKGAATPGTVALTGALLLRMQGMAHWIMWEASAFFENLGTVQDGIETISRPLAVVNQPDAKDLSVSNGEIAFSNVRFHYGKEKGIIENLSLTIKPGEKVGLVGPSGAGKSTIVNLLLRLYDLEAGQIEIDRQNIAAVTQESLRQNIGVVTQDTSLLHRSIEDNIRYGCPSAERSDVISVAEKSKASEFIAELTDLNGRSGFDAHVGERGVKLSGGQRQRIAIARVLLKDAPILILDEATSALDSEIEAAIQDQLRTLMDGKTVIAIAHRLSTIAEMDRLIVLDKGAIVEEGTHRDLVALDGLYARLWNRQSGGFIGGSELAQSAAE